MNDEIETITFDQHDPDLNVHNTSRKIEGVKASFAQLVALFGEPTVEKDPDHSRAWWAIGFSDGAVLTIYDWNEDVALQDVTQWNIGAHDFMTAYRVNDILAGRPIEV